MSSHKQENALIASTPSARRLAFWATAAAVVALAGCAQPAKAPAAAAAPAPAAAPATSPAPAAQAAPGAPGRFLQYVNLTDGVVTVQMTLPDGTTCEALAGPLRDSWKTGMRPSLRPGVTEAQFDDVATKAIRCDNGDQSRLLAFKGAFKTRVNGMLIGLNAITLDQCQRSLGQNSPSVEIVAACK